jgi:plastocyanin
VSFTWLHAPAYPVAGCAGALFLCTLGGCRDVAPANEPVVLELHGDTVTLPAGVRLVEIAVGRTEHGDFDPARDTARAGDVVRFTARDRQTHAIVFQGETLAADAAAFLEGSGQLRGPPLLDVGASWIVSLDGAPPGDYPFHCLTHGQSGRLTVTPAS